METDINTYKHIKTKVSKHDQQTFFKNGTATLDRPLSMLSSLDFEVVFIKETAQKAYEGSC